MSENLRILYVDDEPVNTFLFEQMFNGLYKVYIANSGEDGLAILKEESDISVIFSDMSMPEMNGVEFIKKARALYPNKHYHIISGYLVNDDIEKALSEGLIEQFLEKPFNVPKIKEILDQY